MLMSLLTYKKDLESENFNCKENISENTFYPTCLSINCFIKGSPF